MTRIRGNLVIFIFPYLFIDKEWGIGGYKLKPSYSSIVFKESTRLRGHLDKIARSFKFRNTNLVNQYTYGWVTIHDKEEGGKLKRFLDELSTILRYQELSDERAGANFSNFDYATIEIFRPMSRYKMAFYEANLNGQTTVPIHYPETKFCPNFDLRPYQLMVDQSSKVLSHLFYMPLTFHSLGEEKRIIRALDWFNKSHRSDPEVDDFERLINMATAFESLFDSPEEKILAALRTGIVALLGETKEMVDWINDFYDQRSKTVHGKEKPTTLYKGKKASVPHLAHVRFARKVFTRCVKAILTAREEVYTEDLHKELVSNEIRIKEILVIFKNKKQLKKLYESRVFDTLDSLNQRDVTGKVSDVVEIGKIFLPKIRSFLVGEKKVDLVKQLDAIISYSGSDLPKLGVMYSEFHVGFTPLYFGDKTISMKKLPSLAMKGAIYNFSSYATWKLMIG
ncbi:HEPN domain-containing protein [Patescibacteria group bacterium]|nr:HEPN domain-containing protein [Patescibacteria group bacterium]